MTAIKRDTSPSGSFLGLGAELIILALATMAAGISDDAGTTMVVFVVGLLLVWLIYHTKITNAIPVFLGNLLPTRGN
jgi:hypothetical protein